MLRKALLVATLVALATARPKWHELKGYTFERYVKDFGKPHKKGSAEWARREALFHEEMKAVNAHNVEQHSWKKGINQYSDWTEAEKTRLRGNKVGMKKYGFTKPEKLYSRTVGPLPYSVDWRDATPRVLTAVKDQGQCGSCWAHAATEAIETATALATGNLYVLSQQEIASCTPNPDQCGGTGGCNGAIAELAIDYIKTVGIQEEWTWPYQSYWGKNFNCSVAATSFPVTNVSGYTHVGHNDADAVLDALAHAGPLAISVDASQWSNYESGIFSGCSYAKNISMDHAVQAVGYGFDETANQAYWLVRNSWSAGWGEHGFIRLARSATHACGWNVDPQNGDGCKGQTAPEWACGECGIGYDALYANYAPLA